MNKLCVIEKTLLGLFIQKNNIFFILENLTCYYIKQFNKSNMRFFQ